METLNAVTKYPPPPPLPILENVIQLIVGGVAEYIPPPPPLPPLPTTIENEKYTLHQLKGECDEQFIKTVLKNNY